MSEMNLKQIDVNGLKVFANHCDLRKDLHLFMDYVGNRDVKRSTRGNSLPKMDARRLAGLISDPLAPEEVEEYGYNIWLNYIDNTALKLGFVSYDTEGKYLGYTSSEPSYPDNYIEIAERKYNSFLDMTLQDQENLLLKSLIDKYTDCSNEFFQTGVMGTLDTFSSSGCATGVLPSLNFAGTRNFLLKIMKRCQSGVWYSTASFIRYLKAEHPFFLIPEKPRYKYKSDRLNGRYGNFNERKDGQYHNIKITAEDSNAFERVEGRYVERFLEGIPLALGYVDLGYGKSEYKERKPSLNALKAFKVNECFFRFMEGNIPEPRVTIQPNFEIHVESEFYSAGILARLNPLTDTISENTVTILKLNKRKVTALLANDESLDVVTILRNLSESNVPQNVLTELEEWVGHSEVFTLYHGFGLLEGNPNFDMLKNFTVKNISPALRIVKDPKNLFGRLEEAKLVPMLVKHSDKAFRSLSDGVKSRFPKKSDILARRKKKKTVTLKRKTVITLYFPDKMVFEKCSKALIQKRCDIEMNRENKSISYSGEEQKEINSVLKTLKKEYVINMKDIDW
ncbi:MAG: hypothetical protein LWX54_02090 [Deltaproteobacteria bacterium]|jgi:hypothetical protein|nr:hypothetical protein [Deltaproteobacteria bacterium]